MAYKRVVDGVCPWSPNLLRHCYCYCYDYDYEHCYTSSLLRVNRTTTEYHRFFESPLCYYI